MHHLIGRLAAKVLLWASVVGLAGAVQAQGPRARPGPVAPAVRLSLSPLRPTLGVAPLLTAKPGLPALLASAPPASPLPSQNDSSRNPPPETAAAQARTLFDQTGDFSRLGDPIGDRTLVEGSKKAGGAQNDFLIDYSDRDLLERVVLRARAIGRLQAGPWEKARRVQRLVNESLPRDGLDRKTYDKFNAAALGRSHVRLGDYLRMRTGVCRENALLTALALREAGLKARFAYFQVLDKDGEFWYDHAVALLDLAATTYVVDSYRLLGRFFNGHRLADLLYPPADGRYPSASPLAAGNRSSPGGWSFRHNPFPGVSSL